MSKTSSVRKTSKSRNLRTRDIIASLEKQIAALEKQVAALQEGGLPASGERKASVPPAQNRVQSAKCRVTTQVKITPHFPPLD